MTFTAKRLAAFLYLSLLSNSLFAEESYESHIVLSRVGDYKAYRHEVQVSGADSHRVLGSEADAFTVKRNDSNGIEISLSPNQTKGLYTATLEVVEGGESKLHKLSGVAIEKFEGKNEPSLFKIFKALGIDADVAGDHHTYSTKVEHIGNSQNIEEFRVAEGETEVQVTLLARYSPVGSPEIGFALGGDDNMQKIGNFSNVSEEVPDAHQRLFPEALQGNGSISGQPDFTLPAASCPTKFAFYYKGIHYTSLTYAGRSKGAPIHHTARVFKVGGFMGRELKNAYAICYEEAKNGDYQDAIILVEGVEPFQK